MHMQISIHPDRSLLLPPRTVSGGINNEPRWLCDGPELLFFCVCYFALKKKEKDIRVFGSIDVNKLVSSYVFLRGFFLLFFGFVYLFISSFFSTFHASLMGVYTSLVILLIQYSEFLSLRPNQWANGRILLFNQIQYFLIFLQKDQSVTQILWDTRGMCSSFEKRNSSSLIRLSFVQRCSPKRSNSTYVLCVSRWRECRVMLSGWGSRRRRRRKPKLIFFRFVTLWLRKKEEEEKTNKIEFFFGQQNDYVV